MENRDDERYKKAHKQVQKIKGFYSHLLFSIIAISVCIFINLKYTPEYLWFFWPILGMSIGLLFHAMEAFGFFPFFNKDWEQKKIIEFIEEEKRKQSKYS